MAYTTQAELLKRIDSVTLIALTDDDNSAIDADVLTAAILDADSLIDGYVGRRHEVPLSPVPEIISRFSADITLYFLYSRRDLGVPEVRRQNYEDAIAFLKDVSAGKASLGADDPDGSPPDTSKPQVADTNPTKIFGRGSSGMEEF